MHGLAAAGAGGPFIDLQSGLTDNKLPIAYLAFEALFAIFDFSELIKCVRVTPRALWVGIHDIVSRPKIKVNILCR
jgi:hypothetical protein